LAARALDIFLRQYEAESIARIRTAYLSCFSIARDDENQWKRYGDDGKGVCLGLRLIKEAGPNSRELFSRLFQVIYSEDSLRKWLPDSFEKICSALTPSPVSTQNIKFALTALRGIAALACITTKTSDWNSEQEVRHVTMDRFDPGVKPNVRISANGKEIRYLPVSLRTNGKLIALDEIIVGANQNFEQTREQLEAALASRGYTQECTEYPKVSRSTRGP
jgi:DUF2971 family protein